ncbi:unnamed protein product, partial [Polarella glacialis]
MELDTAEANLLDALDTSQRCQLLAREKGQLVTPLTNQVDEMSRALTVSQRQVELMAQDLDAVSRRAHTVQSAADSERREADQAYSRLSTELHSQLAQLREQATVELTAAARRERLLYGRCQLLKAFSFRAWWSLDGGSAGLEQVEPAKVKPEGVIDSMPLRRVPIPADWRSVLRFQAQMFHWLSAEAMHYRTTAPLPLSDRPLAEEAVFNLGALQSSQADDAQPRCLQAHQPVSARHSLPAATAPAMA